MSSRPPSTGAGATSVPRVLGPGTTFGSFISASERDPQPGWKTLRALVEAAFSGEVRIASTPGFVVYADHGTVYHAARCEDPTIEEQLLARGVITREQLDRGALRVGGQVQLGRLFDRDPTINRSSVAALLNAETDAVLAEIGGLPAVTASATQYLHHPSGVHHWFVLGRGPATSASSSPSLDGNGNRLLVEHPRPNDQRDLEGGHTSAGPVRASADDGREPARRPAMPADRPPDPVAQGCAAPEVSIEWHHDDSDSELAAPENLDDEVPADRRREPVDESIAEVELVEFDADRVDWGPGFQPYREDPDDAEAAAPPPSTHSSGIDGGDGDFQVVWPDGTRQPTHDPLPPSAASAPNGHRAATDPTGCPESNELLDPLEVLHLRPPATSAGRGAGVATPLREHDTDDVADAVSSAAADADIVVPNDTSDDVPEEAADDVRHALQVIEEAVDTGAPAPRRIVIPPPPQPPADVTIEAAMSPNGFAPPTPETTAEAVYARAVEAKVWQDSSTTTHELNGDGDGDSDQRRGALRRLISSLRRNG